MKIVIAASHRFHLLDLAKELAKLGHDVTFYSYVPNSRAKKYGLRKENSKSLFWIMLPFLAIVKFTNGAWWSVKVLNIVLDKYLALFMKPCDIYIAIGYVYKNSFTAAKKKYNAITINDWGSKHNEEQLKVLSHIEGIVMQKTYFRKRQIEAYNLADYIALPADHSSQSFIDRGISKKKIIQNPYGVDLSMFAPTELSNIEQYDVIMVGNWSYVKGCDLLIEFFRNSKLTFIHVGSIGNLPFPDFKNMIHVDSVDQSKLIEYYSLAKVFVLPSRAEGLAMVQSQAIACGLPIVCSKDTGGRDLKKYLDDKKWIIEMEEFSIIELEKCLHKALNLAKTQRGLRDYLKRIDSELTWEAYGIRYNNILENIAK